METETDFIFLGSKITADGDCSHEIKKRLLFGRKTVTNPDSILKRRDITLLAKVCVVKAMIFPVVMYRYERRIIKKAMCVLLPQSCLTLCDPMNSSTSGFPVLHYLPEFAQTHVHWVSDAIQPSHLLSSPSPPIFPSSGSFCMSALCIRCPKHWSFSFSICPFTWIFRVDIL